MYVYSFSAPTSADMRSVLSASSSARPRAVRIATSELSAAGRAAPVTSAASSSQAESTPGGHQRRRQVPGLGHLPALEPVEQLVLAVGGLELVHRLPRRRLFDHLALQRREPRGVCALDPTLGEGPQGGLDRVERVGQLARAAPRRGRRVVELVREAGRHLAQRGHLLALGALGPDPLEDRGEHPEQPPLDLLVGVHHLAQRLARHVPDPAADHRAGAAREGVAGQDRDRADEAAGVVGDLRHQLAVDRRQALHPPVEQHEQVVRPVALLEQPLALPRRCARCSPRPGAAARRRAGR